MTRTKAETKRGGRSGSRARRTDSARSAHKDVLRMLSELTHPPTGGVLYAVLYRNAGWALQFYEGPENEDDSTPDNWRDHLHIREYHPTFEAAIQAEHAARAGSGRRGA